MTGNANVQDCAIWNNVARMTGTVTLTRTATSFSLDFANGLSFTGAITGNQVPLTHVEPHTFTDGCSWQSTETLTGTVDPATCVLTLRTTTPRWSRRTTARVRRRAPAWPMCRCRSRRSCSDQAIRLTALRRNRRCSELR